MRVCFTLPNDKMFDCTKHEHGWTVFFNDEYIEVSGPLMDAYVAERTGILQSVKSIQEVIALATAASQMLAQFME